MKTIQGMKDYGLSDDEIEDEIRDIFHDSDETVARLTHAMGLAREYLGKAIDASERGDDAEANVGMGLAYGELSAALPAGYMYSPKADACTIPAPAAEAGRCGCKRFPCKRYEPTKYPGERSWPGACANCYCCESCHAAPKQRGSE